MPTPIPEKATKPITDDGSGIAGKAITPEQEKNEISDLLDMGISEPVVEDKKEEQVTPTSSSSTVKEEVETPPPSTTPPAVEGEKEEGEEEKEDTLFNELKNLSKLIADDEKSLLGKSMVGEEKAEDSPKEEVKEEKKEEKIEPVTSFIESVLKDPGYKDQDFAVLDQFKGTFEEGEIKQLNSIMNKVVRTAIQEARKASLKDGMEVYPRTLDSRIKGAVAARDFWAKNPEIANLCKKEPDFKKYISRVSSDLQVKNPNMSFDEIFEQTSKHVRKVLGEERMKKFAAKDVQEGPGGNGEGKPSFAQGPTHAGSMTNRSPKVPDTDERSEILELINDVDRY